MPNKMTDNEIKKFLEYLKNDEDIGEDSLVYKYFCQKAEIERLQKYHDDMEDAIYSFREDHAKVKFFKNEIKAEAVKEFAERLKGEMFGKYCMYFDFEITNAIIDNLLKEMVGESDV